MIYLCIVFKLIERFARLTYLFSQGKYLFDGFSEENDAFESMYHVWFKCKGYIYSSGVVFAFGLSNFHGRPFTTRVDCVFVLGSLLPCVQLHASSIEQKWLLLLGFSSRATVISLQYCLWNIPNPHLFLPGLWLLGDLPA